jgi:hypothetical protein
MCLASFLSRNSPTGSTDEAGFSKRESKAIASNGFKAIFPTQQLDEQINALADSLAKYRNIFES